MSAMHKQDAPAPTIEHIMSAISGLEASQDELREMISSAIADARREGAEQMQGAAAALCKAKADREGNKAMETEDDEPDMVDSLKATAWDFMVMESTIRALPLPTGPRQAVRLSDEQILELEAGCGHVRLPWDTRLSIVRAAEWAVLAANGLETK
jgi:hypothetical protein